MMLTADSRRTVKGNSNGSFRKPRSRVLLREPEMCPECSRVYLSLYPIRSCPEHEGLDEV